ncbi:hypothetical protein XHV734_p0049 (plasmid) [Xanthomonas hortorum pv. vitians]|nr:hypothetical protein XHV734_p0049 [Xanthomonas hortorum pv. vitians]
MDAARRPPQGSCGRPRLIHSQRAALPVAVGDSSTYPQASGKLCGQGWAGLPIAGRPRLVHGARPKAGCAGRFRPPGAARTVGKRWANCSPGVGAAGAGSWRSHTLASASWPPIRASGARRPHAAGGVRGPQGRGWKPEWGETRVAGLDAKHDSPTRSKAQGHAHTALPPAVAQPTTQSNNARIRGLAALSLTIKFCQPGLR